MKKAILGLAVLIGFMVAIPILAVQDYRKGDPYSGPLLTPEIVISKDLMGGHSAKHKVAKNTDIDTSVEDLIDNGGAFSWPTSAKALQFVSSSTRDIGGKKATGTLSVVDYSQMLGTKSTGTLTVVDWRALKTNNANGTITIADYSKFSGVKATARITVTGYASVVNGTVLTLNGQTSNTIKENIGWTAATNNNATANGLASAITSFGNGFTASAALNVVTLSYTSNGFTGNTKTVALNHTNGLTLSNATLVNGRPLVVIGVNGTNLTSGSSFLANGSNFTTAMHLAAAINGTAGLSEIDATWDENRVYLTFFNNGTVGNAATISSNNNNGATVSAATLRNGRVPTTIAVNGNNLVESVDFTSANGNEATASAIKTAFNALTANGAIYATSALNVVTFTYGSNGEIAKTLTSNNHNGATVSGANITNGEDLLTLTVNGKTFVAGTRFTPATSNTVTAAAIVTMLNANGSLANDLIATSSGATITLTALAEGTAGNSITTSSNDTDSLTAAAATLKYGKSDSNGANLITVKGLNGGYLAQEEDVIINGTGFATTVNTYLRLNEAFVKESGTNGMNIGNIAIRQNGNALLMAKIAAQDNISYSSTYTVPDDHSAYITNQSYSVLTASPWTTADLELRVRPYGGVFKTQQFDGIGNGNIFMNKPIAMPVKITEKSDIIIRGSTGANNTSITGSYDLIEAED